MATERHRGLSDQLLAHIETVYDRLEHYGFVPTLTNGIALLFVIWTLFPVYWMVAGSLRTRREGVVAAPTGGRAGGTIADHPAPFLQRRAF